MQDIIELKVKGLALPWQFQDLNPQAFWAVLNTRNNTTPTEPLQQLTYTDLTIANTEFTPLKDCIESLHAGRLSG